MAKVVIDAGHGGEDPGASSNGIIEKEYTLKISEYIYMFSILIVYLITAKIDNSIMGCGIYIIISCVLIFIFMKETMFYCINESKKYLNNIILRIRKKEN